MSERLAAAPRDYDIVVVGGGINGAGVARDAALRGFRVALVEQHDFGSGSSSRTSKLVHGGVRYLEHGELRLVWEASRERRRLLHLAPHLVQPLPFILPVYRDSRFGPARLRAGMLLYDLLAAFRNVHPHRALAAARTADWGEGLRRDGLRGAARYWDAAMNDARLVLANVMGARAAGAAVFNRAALERLCIADGRVTGVQVRDLETGTTVRWETRAVAVCAGAWTDGLLAAIPGTSPALAPTRGTHIVVRPLVQQAFTLAAGRDGRVFFVLPWDDATLIGTTDVADSGAPEAVTPTEDEIAYLIEETNRYFPAAALQRHDVRAAFAGLRPLLRAGGAESSRSREHALLEPARGVIAVAGGKYTTYRAVAESVVDRLERALGRRGACCTHRLPLPGGELPWPAPEQWNRGPRFAAAARALAARAGVDPAIAQRWLAVYGSHAEQVVRLIEADASMRTPLHASQPELRAELVHAIRNEMALQLEDWFLRRTRLAFAPGNGLATLDAAAAVFAAESGWSPERRAAEIDACRRTLRRIAASAPGTVPAGD